MCSDVDRSPQISDPLRPPHSIIACSLSFLGATCEGWRWGREREARKAKFALGFLAFSSTVQHFFNATQSRLPTEPVTTLVQHIASGFSARRVSLELPVWTTPTFVRLAF